MFLSLPHILGIDSTSQRTPPSGSRKSPGRPRGWICPRGRGSWGGFTLVELLLSVFVIGILFGIVMGVVPQIRIRSESVVTISNMRQIVAAMNLYANEHGGDLPPRYNETMSDRETWRQRQIFALGYVDDVEIFNNPTNRRLRDGAGLGGGDMFIVGADQNTSFSSSWKIYTEWEIGPSVETPENLYSNLDVPILWDHRADRLWSENYVTTSEGTPGGHFAYVDGEVRLIGPPDHVIRGESFQ